MAGAIKARKRRRSVAIGVSLLAHALAFTIIVLNVPQLVVQPPPPSSATNIWLMPRLFPRPERMMGRAAPARSAPPISSAADKPKTRAAQGPSPIPAPAAPTANAAAGIGPSGVAETGGGVLGALRTSIGCDLGHTAHLTPEEKDRCNQRIGEEAHKGPKFIDIIPPEKRAYYDAVQQAYQAAHDPTHRMIRDANGNIKEWGTGPGVGCGMKFGGPPQPPDHRSLADKIKATGLLGFDLGPIRCGIVIPQGAMTPEIGIPTP